MRGERVEVGRQWREQDLVGVRCLEAGERAERGARLAQHLKLDPAVLGERFGRQRSGLILGQHAGAHPLELRDHGVEDRLVDHAGLLGGADHRGVERLRDEDVDDGHPDIGAAMQIHGRVARADAQAGLALRR